MSAIKYSKNRKIQQQNNNLLKRKGESDIPDDYIKQRNKQMS